MAPFEPLKIQLSYKDKQNSYITCGKFTNRKTLGSTDEKVRESGKVYRRVWGFPGGGVETNPLACAGTTRDSGLVPGSGRSPGVRNGDLLQCSCLENPMDRGAWLAIVHGVAESTT